MADNKTKTDNRDRSKVAGDEKYEIDYLVEQLNVPRKQVLAAIQEVGNDRKKIEAYLKKK
jgi:hypothetical protein